MPAWSTAALMEQVPKALIEGETTNALVARFRRDVESGKGREEGTWVA